MHKNSQMDLYEILDTLGKAFSDGEIDALAELLNENCKYNSDYAHKRLTSAKHILDSMHNVYSAVREKFKSGEDCTYSYAIIELNSVFKENIRTIDLSGKSFYGVEEKGLLLFQYGASEPVAVVFVKTNHAGYLTEINLSRNHTWFDLNFYGEDGLEDSENDIPYTVEAMSSYDGRVKAMQAEWKCQNPKHEELDDTEVYIWRKADEYICDRLEGCGYNIAEKQIYDDCIGYRCNRKSQAYTVYMYAYGQSQTVMLDGDYCAKLLDYKFSEKSTVLVVYLNVKRFKEGDEVKYSVCNYCGEEDDSPELWKVTELNGKKILQYYPQKEVLDALQRFMYAFNRDDGDVYDCIMSEEDSAFDGIGSDSFAKDDEVYSNMLSLHRKYGDMKIGYVRYNDEIYSQAPYLENYGFFSITTDGLNKIWKIIAHSFDESRIKEFVKTDERESDGCRSSIPTVIAVEALPPVLAERFALKLDFDNGECKKYVLPINEESENSEAVSFANYVFTDEIWATAKKEKSAKPHCGMSVCFANKYEISVMKCYEEGTPYAEPELCGEVVYEDDKYSVEKCWKWYVNAVYEDEETGLLKVLISGFAFNYCGISTFASKDGIRLTGIDFDYIDDFCEGLAKVAKYGYGHGFVDANMNLVIPMIYEAAENFKNGWAAVKRNGKWLHINKTGRECVTASAATYQKVGDFHEGMCKVSTLKLDFMDLAYHTEYAQIAGTWGFINESGEEVVAPQYIYAEDFCGGIAVVCKGKWTVDKKWDNEYNTSRYWTEKALWGAIDKHGNEVVPFIFDEINRIGELDDIFMAHYGGWENGHWGVIDNHGCWLAEPIFEYIVYGYHDGLFAFGDKGESSDGRLYGIYDIKQKQVIFKPQFCDVSFLDDGWISVKVFNEELGREIEKLIDRNGNEKFHSIYSSICAREKGYEVAIWDESGSRHGLVDENGDVILLCEHDVAWNGIVYEQGLVVFCDDDRKGVRDFDGNIIVEPKYHEMHSADKPMLIVKVGDAENYKESMISKSGKEVIPADFERISWLSGNYFVCCKSGLCEMYRVTEKS